MIKAVIFDLDGVLVDATEWHYGALNRALALFGFNIDRGLHLSEYNGLPTKEKLKRLSNQKEFPLSLLEFTNEMKQKYTIQEIEKNCNPVFEKQFMISRLKKDGYVLAVCSNSIKESVFKMLNNSGILDYFEMTVGNDEGYPNKPSPVMYIETIKKLGVSPKEVIIVEDSPHGINAAKLSGANVCEVKGFSEVNYDLIKKFIRKIESQKNKGSIDNISNDTLELKNDKAESICEIYNLLGEKLNTDSSENILREIKGILTREIKC